MAQPVAYDRQFNFQNQQALTPAAPVPAQQLDAEFNALKVTIDQILNNLALIQRDDGALRNLSVGRATLNTDVTLGFGAPKPWETETSYTADFDTVFANAKFYECAVSHVSSDDQIDGFAADLAAGKWREIADFTAAAINDLGTLAQQDADDVQIEGGTIDGVAITGLPAPSGDDHAATKLYVDTAEADAAAYTDDEITALAATLRGELNAPTGTRMLFQQTTAPTGWTKDTTHNDKALRVVSGSVTSGGTVAFSTVFARTATDSHVLTVSQMPSHNHGGSTGTDTPDHTHPYIQFTGSGSTAVQNGGFLAQAPGDNVTVTSGGASARHIHSITPQGGGQGHEHNIDLRVQYVDIIIAVKD